MAPPCWRDGLLTQSIAGCTAQASEQYTAMADRTLSEYISSPAVTKSQSKQTYTAKLLAKGRMGLPRRMFGFIVSCGKMAVRCAKGNTVVLVVPGLYTSGQLRSLSPPAPCEGRPHTTVTTHVWDKAKIVSLLVDSCKLQLFEKASK